MIKKFNHSVPEGHLNVKGLKKYLTDNNLPLMVCVCEDATALVGRREYHNASNGVMGFSLPMERNGLRNANLLKVKNASDIVKLVSCGFCYGSTDGRCTTHANYGFCK